MVVVAPTGIAAINAGGVTIHSFFQLPLSPFVPNTTFKSGQVHYRFGKEKQNIIRTMEMLKKNIRPEFLNRIDETIMFLPLTEAQIREIVTLQVNGVEKMLRDNGVDLKLTDAAIGFLAQSGFDPEFGARPVKRAIQRYLLNDLSKKLIGQEVNRDKTIVVDYDDKKQELVYNN